MSSNLAWLQSFYLSLCNEDWEHSYGCTIENLDNPGWSFRFELNDTSYENADMKEMKWGADTFEEGADWMFLKKEDALIEGACGPTKLDELIGKFRTWVEKID